MNRWLRLLLWVLYLLVALAFTGLAAFGALMLYMHFNPIRLGRL